MHTFIPLVAVASLASLAIAGPVLQPRKGFTLQQGAAKKGKSGPEALAHAYAKYGMEVPSHVAAAAAPQENKSGSGNVTATPEQNDQSYLCPVTIGGQTLNLDFDTGSADLWVFSTEQPSSQSDGHTLYNPGNAQKIDGATWKITYGDGSGAKGDVYSDTVNIGGVTVTSQAVEAAQSVSAMFTRDTANNGLVGLAFSSSNTVQPNQQTTFFDTAVNEGALAQNLFGVDLKAGNPGSYDFGYIDNSKYTGSITYTDVDNSQGFWSFTSSGYAVGDGDFTSSSSSGIADTGTSLILLSNDIVSAYYSQVSGSHYSSNAGGYIFPCSTSLPDFIVGVGSSQFTIPGSYMNFAPIDKTNTTCYGGIQRSGHANLNIYGDVFLKALYVVFDSDGPQLGFATKSL